MYNQNNWQNRNGYNIAGGHQRQKNYGVYSPQGYSQKYFKKHSGATHSTYVPKEGPNKGQTQYITNAWKYIKGRGLLTFKCVTTSKSKITDEGWMGSVACEMVNKTTAEVQFFWGMMEAKTGKVVIPALSWVLNPRAKNGGYCGTFIDPNNPKGRKK